MRPILLRSQGVRCPLTPATVRSSSRTAAGGNLVQHQVRQPEHTLPTPADRHNFRRRYTRAGRIHDAITTGQRVVADFERLRGADDPDTLAAQANLARIYDSAGRTSEATALAEPGFP